MRRWFPPTACPARCAPFGRFSRLLAAAGRTILLPGFPPPLRIRPDGPPVCPLTTRCQSSSPAVLLHSFGVEPLICPPRRPDLKPFVERCIRTLKYECLYPQPPQ